MDTNTFSKNLSLDMNKLRKMAQDQLEIQSCDEATDTYDLIKQIFMIQTIIGEVVHDIQMYLQIRNYSH